MAYLLKCSLALLLLRSSQDDLRVVGLLVLKLVDKQGIRCLACLVWFVPIALLVFSSVVVIVTGAVIEVVVLIARFCAATLARGVKLRQNCL